MYSVKQQQTFLKYYYAYYDGSIDGVSGKKTKSAIKLFQENHGLTADGIWGKNTDAKAVEVVKKIQEALNKTISSPINIDEVITDIQKMLQGVGVGALKVNNITNSIREALEKEATTLTVDGVFGESTKLAVEKFQQENSLEVDGCVGMNTALKLFGKELITPVKVKDWSLYPNFKADEFKCKCGGKYCDGFPEDVDTALVEMLQTIRNKYNKPLIITSAVRCKNHNRNVQGVGNSRHLNGKAVDFYIEGVSGKELRALCYELGCRYSYIIVGDVIHADVH